MLTIRTISIISVVSFSIISVISIIMLLLLGLLTGSTTKMPVKIEVALPMDVFIVSFLVIFWGLHCEWNHIIWIIA